MDDNRGDATHDCDVLVIGGGPAGSTAASLLAERGWDVLVLDKARHPRFHIGESLLPMNRPIFERLGVLDKVAALGVVKHAADFEADNECGYNKFDFSQALGDSPPHAWQVPRDAFDAMLLEAAREHGARVQEGVEVREVEQRGTRESCIRTLSEEGEHALTARYVIDASGRDALLSGRRKLIRRNRQHQSAALFGHFRGAGFRPGAEAGNISIYRFEHGWMWMIPLPGGVMSVGAVCRPAYLRQRRGDNTAFFLDTLQANPRLWQRLQGAELIDGAVRVTGNYSYDSACIGGPGWVLAGDAFGFLDPVFSSGVYLAMSGGAWTADMVDAALRDPACETRLQQRLEKRVRTGMRRFAWFVYHFNSPGMRRLFRNPRNVLNVERAVISMLAGDVFDNRRVLRRLWLFRFLHAVANLTELGRWWGERRDHRAQARLDAGGG